MPGLLWLSLLLGYVVGVAGALFLLPSAVVEPFIGRLLVASVVIMAGATVFYALQRRHTQRAAPSEGAVDGEIEADDDETEADFTDEAERIDDVAGDAGKLATLGRARLEPLARAPDGSISPRELRQILYDGRVEILGRPVLSLPGRTHVYTQVTPRLLDHEEQPLLPSLYKRTVARCGLEAVLDRVQVIRALQTASAAEGSAGVEPIGVPISMRGLSSPVLLDGLEDALQDEQGEPDRLILEADCPPRDPLALEAMRRLRRLRVRLALKRLSTAPLDLERVAAQGFSFLHLAGAAFVRLPADRGGSEAPDALLAAAEQVGLAVVIDEPGSTPAPLLAGLRIDTPLPPPAIDTAADDAA